MDKKLIQAIAFAGGVISGVNSIGYERAELLTLDEVFAFVGTDIFPAPEFRLYKYWSVDISDDRYLLFRRQHTCTHCGVEGLYFALERNMRRVVVSSHEVTGTTSWGRSFKRQQHTYGWDYDPNAYWHFNLYGIKDGKEVMLTKDHIVPKSKGGANTQENYQCMCRNCNGNKADTVSKEGVNR